MDLELSRPTTPSPGTYGCASVTIHAGRACNWLHASTHLRSLPLRTGLTWPRRRLRAPPHPHLEIDAARAPQKRGGYYDSRDDVCHQDTQRQQIRRSHRRPAWGLNATTEVGPAARSRFGRDQPRSPSRRTSRPPTPPSPRMSGFSPRKPDRILEHLVFNGRAGPAKLRIQQEADAATRAKLMLINYERIVADPDAEHPGPSSSRPWLFRACSNHGLAHGAGAGLDRGAASVLQLTTKALAVGLDPRAWPVAIMPYARWARGRRHVDVEQRRPQARRERQQRRETPTSAQAASSSILPLLNTWAKMSALKTSRAPQSRAATKHYELGERFHPPGQGVPMVRVNLR